MADGIRKVRCGSSQMHTVGKDIGPEGGRIGHAGHELNVPPGALAQTSRFVFIVPASEYLEVDVTMHPAQSFAKPSTLTLNYAHCQGLPKDKFIAELDQNGRPVQPLPSEDHGNRVSASLHHFTKYALATGS